MYIGYTSWNLNRDELENDNTHEGALKTSFRKIGLLGEKVSKPYFVFRMEKNKLRGNVFCEGPVSGKTGLYVDNNKVWESCYQMAKRKADALLDLMAKNEARKKKTRVEEESPSYRWRPDDWSGQQPHQHTGQGS